RPPAPWRADRLCNAEVFRAKQRECRYHLSLADESTPSPGGGPSSAPNPRPLGRVAATTTHLPRLSTGRHPEEIAPAKHPFRSRAAPRPLIGALPGRE